MRFRGVLLAALLLAGCEDKAPPAAAVAPGVVAGASADPTWGTPAGTLPGIPGGVTVPGPAATPVVPPERDTGNPSAAPGSQPTATPGPGGIPPGAETQPGWPQPKEAFELDVPSPPPATAFAAPTFPLNGLPAGAGTIRGRVVDPMHGNAPVAGAWVVAIAAQDRTKVSAHMSAADGTWSFAGVALGSYFVQASRAGYRSAAEPRYLTLSPGLPVLAGATFVLVGP